MNTGAKLDPSGKYILMRGDQLEVLDLLNKIAPEIFDIIEKRYLILSSVAYNQPIGRRALSNELSLKERFIRDEANVLKEQGLLNIDIRGMYISDEGRELLSELQSVYSILRGIPKLEEELERKLGIKKVIIAPGNFEDNSMMLGDMSKIASKVIKDVIRPKDIIGITGGSTMAAVAEGIAIDNKKRDIVVVPARGGLGEEVESQSNSIAAKVAKHLGGSYRLLYVPDGLGEEGLQIMLKNEEIKESVKLINNMNTLIFGIGRGDTMAKRRNLPKEKIEELIEKGAVAEAFGHYFDIKGREIWEYKTIGMSIDKFRDLDIVIGVAGGETKSDAIIAIATLKKDMILITDEAAAKKILETKLD